MVQFKQKIGRDVFPKVYFSKSICAKCALFAHVLICVSLFHQVELLEEFFMLIFFVSYPV